MKEDLSNEWNCRNYKDRWIIKKEIAAKHMAFFFVYFGMLGFFAVIARMQWLFFFSLCMMICAIITASIYHLQMSMYANTYAIIRAMEVSHGKINKCPRRR